MPLASQPPMHATARLIRLGPGLPAPKPGARPRRGILQFLGAHKIATTLVALLLVTASVGVALVVFGQQFIATPTAGTSPVPFSAGDDITSLVNLGLATAPVISAGGASASITIYGIPGASALSLGEILELTNTDTADNADFTVSLSVSGTPAASLTGFTITFLDDVSGTPTLRTWNLLTTPTLTTYTLSDGEVWELNISSLTMTAAATGSQGALTITATITQV